jgi:type VI protein secretion system component VasK
MTEPMADDPRAVRRAALRKATLHLVLGIVILDAVAMGLFYALGIPHGPERTRTIFVAVWTFATAITVAFLLRRVRQTRYLARR